MKSDKSTLAENSASGLSLMVQNGKTCNHYKWSGNFLN